MPACIDPVTIILADDHRLLRQGIRSLIEKEADLTVIDEADNGNMLLELVAKNTPDVVIMDISMPERNGIETTRQLHADFPDVRILALSMHDDGQYVRNMLAAGASGYLLKANAFEELTQAIRSIMQGNVFVSSELSGILMNDYKQRLQEAATAQDPLSPREREVLRLLAEGLGAKEVAAELNISANTVDTHRKHIMEKLGINSMAALTKYAIREGITTLDS